MSSVHPILGVDVSEMQPAGLSWSEWSDRASIAVVRASIGFREDAAYEQFVTLAHAAGFTVGAYHALLGHQFYDPVRQARDFIGLIMPQVAFVALDIEAPGTSRADVAAFVATYQAEGPGLPLLLYGNAALETLLGAGAYPALGLWYADYGDGLVTSIPRPGTPRRINVGAFRGHQFAGNNGRLAPYTGQIDLTNWEQSPTEGNDMPITLTDAQVKQFSAVLDDLTLHLAQIKSQAAAWQTYAQAEADYILTLRPLLVLTPPPPPVKHTMATLSNQTVINLFARVLTLALLEGGLTPAQKATLYGARLALYTGPAVEDFSNLTDAYKSALINGLGLPVG